MPHIIQPGDPLYCVVDEKLTDHGRGRYRTQLSGGIQEQVLRLMRDVRQEIEGIHGMSIFCGVDDELLRNYFYRIKDPYLKEGLSVVDDYEKTRDSVIALAKSKQKHDGGVVVYTDGRIKGGYSFTANLNTLGNSFGIDFRDIEEEIFHNRDAGGTRTVSAIAAAYVIVGGYIGLLRKHNGFYVFQNEEGVITLPHFEGNSEVDPNTRIDTNKREESGEQGAAESLEEVASATE